MKRLSAIALKLTPRMVIDPSKTEVQNMGKTKEQVKVYLDYELFKWLKSTGNMSKTITRLIEKERSPDAINKSYESRLADMQTQLDEQEERIIALEHGVSVPAQPPDSFFDDEESEDEEGDGITTPGSDPF